MDDGQYLYSYRPGRKHQTGYGKVTEKIDGAVATIMLWIELFVVGTIRPSLFMTAEAFCLYEGSVFMSIFSGLFRSRDKPQNRTAGSAYTFYIGGTTSGKAVTERSAIQMTAVYSCVRILAEAVAGLPLHLYKYR